MVVLNAQTGDVVALASAPTFDISKFTTGIPTEEFNVSPTRRTNFPLINRAVQGLYAPGSTFKTFTALRRARKTMLHRRPDGD